jgi:hypothetical protein
MASAHARLRIVIPKALFLAFFFVSAAQEKCQRAAYNRKVIGKIGDWHISLPLRADAAKHDSACIARATRCSAADRTPNHRLILLACLPEETNGTTRTVLLRREHGKVLKARV